MKGFIVKMAAAACLTGGLIALTGCCNGPGYRELVDPCYPWRYCWQAQNEVCEPFAVQVNNGHVLDQTVWNSDFEPGKATLTQGGLDHLQVLVRRRPHPDPIIYLATADVPYNPDVPPEAFAQVREKLNQARIESIQRYLAAETMGRNLVFQVYVHDPAEPYVAATSMQRSVTGMQAGFRGGLTGGGAPAGGGGAPAP
jgi:hypothetical protein